MTRRGCEGAGARACAIVTLGGFLLAACFSERSPAEIDAQAVCSVPVDELSQGGEFVPIQGFDYLIDTLRVTAGTRVTWVNCERPPGEAHTVTSDNGIFDSPFISVGQTYSRTFDVPGTFPYHCIPHPHMRAVIIVL
jgi:plastocyanin